MGFKDLHLKFFKAIRIRRFLTREGRSRKYVNYKKQSCNNSIAISHGFYISQNRSFVYGSDELESDSVVVQKEQIQDSEVWMFGISDAQTGDGVTKYLRSQLFNRKLTQNQIKRRSKETMKKAYLSSKAKLLEGGTQTSYKTSWTTSGGGSTSVIVINSQKIVAANMGDYKTVVCRDGVAYQICQRNQSMVRRRWSLNFISGAFHRHFLDRGGGYKPSNKSSEPDIGVEKIDYDTEFLILASNGIWEVMNNQEAMNLIRHIDDPQEAAECLAKEALTRFSKSNISCLIIRFD